MTQDKALPIVERLRHQYDREAAPEETREAADIIERLYGALDALLDGYPLPHNANEYELVQMGYDPTEARKIAAGVAALRAVEGEQSR